MNDEFESVPLFDIHEDSWMPPANPHEHDILMVGDSVGCGGGEYTASLGPVLEISGKRYCLVSCQLFEGLAGEDREPLAVPLIHPSPFDCPPGREPREIGVLRYWPGPPYQTSRRMRPKGWGLANEHAVVVTDWALCQIKDGIRIENQLRHAPKYRNYSGRIQGFQHRSPKGCTVWASGRSSGARWAKVCDSFAQVEHRDGDGTVKLSTRELYLESTVRHLPGSVTTENWNRGGPGMPGDAGAAVFNPQTGQLIGIVWGRNVFGGDRGIQRIAYFSSILDILDDIRDKYPELGPVKLSGTASEASGDYRDPSLSTTGARELLSPELDATDEARSSLTPFPPSVDHEDQTPAYDDDQYNPMTSDVESVFSDLGSESSQSSIQEPEEAQALRETLAALFLTDPVVADAFCASLARDGVGGERITTEFRRALREMGKALREDSEKMEQRLCARRIRRDAGYIAVSARQKFDVAFEFRELNPDQAPMSEEDRRRRILTLLLRNNPSQYSGNPGHEEGYPGDDYGDDEDDDDSDDETTRAKNEQALYAKIQEVEEFITSSEHMQNLRSRLQAFSSQEIYEKRTQETRAEASLPELVDKWFPQWLDSLLEPRIPRGAERIRWTCVCGKRLYDDYFGLKPGASRRIRAKLAGLNSTKSATFTSPATGKRWVTDWINAWSKRAASIVSAAGNVLGRGVNNQDSQLPGHNPTVTPPPSQSQSSRAFQRPLFLLFCVQTGQEGNGRLLHQEDVPVSELNNDRDLFRFLGDIYRAKRKWRSRFTLRAVSEVGNCKIHVDFSELVSKLHRHYAACTGNAASPCPCWPERTNDGYGYVVGKPLDESFDVEKNYILHCFQHPECLQAAQRSVICHVPMKKDTRLEGAVDKPSPGWGVYFEEGWHVKTIWVIVLVLMLVSFAFSVTWWLVMSDIQGAFGAGSYCVAFAALLMGFLAQRSF